jgi:hypothetical protein
MDIFEAMAAEYLRHPGAGGFIRSRAIGDDRAVPRDVVEMSLHLIGWHAQCPGYFHL